MKKLLGFLTIGITLLIACNKQDFQELEPREWKLVWSDEFAADSLVSPDSEKWTFDIGNGIDGWGNQELQSYTDSPDNVSHDGNGNMIIRAIQNGTSFTSGRIKTQGLYSQKYGRIEARLKTPYGPGLWPAFWLLGDNITTNPWPQCGEIDIMELRGQQPHIIYSTIHGPGYSGGGGISKGYALENGRYDTKFHLFAAEWDEDKIDFFVDDFLYHRIEREDVPGAWVFDQPFFIIMNVAVGGNYVGFPTSQTPFPQEMVVDYVRVYDRVN
jgi:beta-glucanase (GH16 family)